ncbi:uncharacterized protein [Atheta coriaria]|uniref:uncharacterized protein n=1 Tax=Dalotia coriaria TaxID=877792 RepID=UPI0031F3535E
MLSGQFKQAISYYFKSLFHENIQTGNSNSYFNMNTNSQSNFNFLLQKLQSLHGDSRMYQIMESFLRSSMAYQLFQQGSYNYLQALNMIMSSGFVSAEVKRAASYYLEYLNYFNVKQQYGVDKLFTLIPQTQFGQDHGYYEKMRQLFTSTSFLNIIKQSNITVGNDQSKMLHDILLKVLQSLQMNSEYRQAIQYYFKSMYNEDASMFTSGSGGFLGGSGMVTGGSGGFSGGSGGFSGGSGMFRNGSTGFVSRFQSNFDFLLQKLQNLHGDSHMYQIIESFMRSSAAYQLFQQGSYDYIQALNMIMSSGYVSAEVKRAASYYLEYLNYINVKNKYGVDRLFTLIPQTQFAQDQGYYEKMRQLFTSTSFLSIIKQSNLTVVNDQSKMLHDLLLKVLQSLNMNSEYREAITYYFKSMYNEDASMFTSGSGGFSGGSGGFLGGSEGFSGGSGGFSGGSGGFLGGSGMYKNGSTGFGSRYQSNFNFLLQKLQNLHGDSRMYQIIESFMRSSAAYQLFQQGSYDYIQALNMIMSSGFVSAEVKRAASYYLEYLSYFNVKNKYGIDKLFTLIPQPQIGQDRGYYDKMKQLFTSTSFLNIIKQSNMTVVNDQSKMLHDLLLKVLQSMNLSMDYKQAISYYFKSMYNEDVSMFTKSPIMFGTQIQKPVYTGGLISSPSAGSSNYDFLLQKLESLHGDYHMFQVISSFMRTSMAYQLFQQGNFDYLQALRMMASNAYIPLEVKNAASYYLQYLDYFSLKQKYNVDNLFSMIPQPKIGVEKGYYDKIRSLFTSTAFLQTLRQSNMTIVNDQKTMLHDMLLNALSNLNLGVEYKQAIQYYFKSVFNEEISMTGKSKVQSNFDIMLQKLQSLHGNNRMYQIIKSFLTSNTAYQLFQNGNFDYLQALNMIRSSAFVSSEVRSAASYYLEYLDYFAVRNKYGIDKLFTIIPQPSVDYENMYFRNIQNLFTSTNFLQIIKQMNLPVVSDQKMMLHNILTSALKNINLNQEYRQSILYYLKSMYNEGLTVQQQQYIEYLLQELRSVQIDGNLFGLISSFLTSDQAYMIFQDGFDFSQSAFTALEQILEKMGGMTYLDAQTLRAASYYKQQVHQTLQYESMVMTKVQHAFTSLQGVSSNIVSKYQTNLANFLQSQELHTILRHAHFNYNMDEREILYNILMIVQEDVNVANEIREGAYHYAKYILEPLLGNIPCNMDALMSFLPQPTNYLSNRYFNTLRLYLQYGVPRFLISQIDFTKTGLSLLLDILQALVYSDQIPVDVRGTARFYLQLFNSNTEFWGVNLLRNKLDRLTLLLPRPKSIHEAQYYNLMINYFKGNEILQLLNTITLNLHKPDLRILRDILVLTQNTKLVLTDMKIVADYYLKMINKGMIGGVSNIYFGNNPMTLPTAPTIINPGYLPTTGVVVPRGTPPMVTPGPAMPSPTTVMMPSAGTTTLETNQASMSSAISRIESEFNSMNISETYQSDRQTLLNYLHSPLGKNLILSSGISLNASNANLLSQFIQTAAHTNDIPMDLRLASERYEMALPSLKQTALMTPWAHLIPLDNLFHKIVPATINTKSIDFIICYNAIDRYLHTEVPAIIRQDTNIDLKIAPMELLQDFMLIAREIGFADSEITLIQSQIQPTPFTFGVMQKPHLDHLYKLCKAFQLIQLPSGKENMRYYYAVDNFFRSNTMYELLQQSNIDFSQNQQDLLRTIFTVIINSQNSAISREILQAAIYYNNEMYKPTLQNELDYVFHLVPAPQGEQATQAYNTFNQYIHSEQATETYQNLNFMHQQPGLILNNMLDMTSHNEKISESVRSAAAYLQQNNQEWQMQESQSMQAAYAQNSMHSMKSLGYAPIPMPITSQAPIALPLTTQQPYFDFKVFGAQIPPVAYPEEERFRTVLIQFLGSDLIYHCFNQSAQFGTDLNSFKTILTQLSTNPQVPADVKQACIYYLNHAPFFDYKSLISLIPEPARPNLKKLYEHMVQFLSNSALINKVTQNINLSAFASNELILKEILNLAEQCDWLDEPTRVAATYFKTLIKSEAISMQRVFTKTLDLSDIFNDVFDFSVFSKMQFDAFHHFWSYVNKDTQELLSSPGFEFWTSNIKRGAFTNKFLAALSTKPGVPGDVLEAITVLTPLVQVTNGGALDL